MISLYEILVPVEMPVLEKDGRIISKRIKVKYHRIWDDYVRNLISGLTIMRPVKGQWIDKITNRMYSEPMIPVRIACTPNDLVNIADFTAKHYNQKAVMYYKISDEVFIRKYE